MTSFDAIVIGGGHNGLACATMLGRSGRKVLLLEAAPEIGGAARMQEFAPGFRASLVPLINRLHAETIKALDLKKHGLALGPCDLPSVALSPGREPLVLRGAYGETTDGLAQPEAESWRLLRAQLFRFAGILRPFLFRPPPDLGGGSLSEKAALGSAALGLRRLGREDMRDFLRLALSNVSDLLDEHLADDRLKGLLAFDAVLGSQLGPRSPTSLMGLYYRLSGDIDGIHGGQAMPRGGAGAVIAAMQRAAEHAGVSIRCRCPVARVKVMAGRARGVILTDGQEFDAPVIVSAANPKTTFGDLVGAPQLDTGFAARVRNIRMKGNVARLDLALDRTPTFPAVDANDANGRIVLAPSIDHVERAFNPSKYGELPDHPVIELVVSSLADPSLAPDGAAVLSANIQFAPYDLKEGWDAGRLRLLDRVLGQLEMFSPGLRSTILHAHLQSPGDIERDYLMPGGHWHHGELQVDQMLVNRPVFGAARYGTPVDGLYISSAGSHPGGGVSGIPGINAARQILAMETA